MIHASRKPSRKFVLAIMLCLPAKALLAQAITVVSFGGSYARASQEAYHKPFTEETGIEIRLEDYNGGLAQIRAQVDAGAVHWDVVDLNLDDARWNRHRNEAAHAQHAGAHRACRAQRLAVVERQRRRIERTLHRLVVSVGWRASVYGTSTTAGMEFLSIVVVERIEPVG